MKPNFLIIFYTLNYFCSSNLEVGVCGIFEQNINVYVPNKSINQIGMTLKEFKMTMETYETSLSVVKFDKINFKVHGICDFEKIKNIVRPSSISGHNETKKLMTEFKLKIEDPFCTFKCSMVSTIRLLLSSPNRLTILSPLLSVEWDLNDCLDIRKQCIEYFDSFLMNHSRNSRFFSLVLKHDVVYDDNFICCVNMIKNYVKHTAFKGIGLEEEIKRMKEYYKQYLYERENELWVDLYNYKFSHFYRNMWILISQMSEVVKFPYSAIILMSKPRDLIINVFRSLSIKIQRNNFEEDYDIVFYDLDNKKIVYDSLTMFKFEDEVCFLIDELIENNVDYFEIISKKGNETIRSLDLDSYLTFRN